MAECGCPVRAGHILHQRGACTDPLVARLGWYATPAGRCPVCVMVCAAWPTPDPRRPGLVRLTMHTHPAVAHLADLLRSADVVMICIGSGDDVRPYDGPLSRGEYAHAR